MIVLNVEMCIHSSTFLSIPPAHSDRIETLVGRNLSLRVDYEKYSKTAPSYDVFGVYSSC